MQFLFLSLCCSFENRLQLNPLYTDTLFHCYIFHKSICRFRGVRSILSLPFYFWWKILLANPVDADQTSLYVASDLGLRCLPITLYGFPCKNGLSPATKGCMQSGNKSSFRFLLVFTCNTLSPTATVLDFIWIHCNWCWVWRLYVPLSVIPFDYIGRIRLGVTGYTILSEKHLLWEKYRKRCFALRIVGQETLSAALFLAGKSASC